jgi:serine/threonine protein kinase
LSSLLETPAPRRLGRYQLLERIAVGGMAEVYRAVALGLSGFEKTVVIKRLLPQHHRDQELLTMFIDEARLLGRLRHPNIAEVYDIDHEGNEYFFALEYVDGVELRDLLNVAPLSLSDAVLVTLDLAQALGYAHSLQDGDAGPLGIVHRDISPSNVLISQEGSVKLVDFGVAKWRSQRSETRHGVLKGKVNYMSPEQCRGEPLDKRSDVFALGVLLYEMSVGVRPFEGSSDFETLKAIAEGHYLAPRARLATYPAELERICGSMLELDREQRLGDMSEVASALRGFASGLGLNLDSKSLATKASETKLHLEHSGQRASEQSASGIDVDYGALRLSIDRTATATSTIESFATAGVQESKMVARRPVAGVPALGLGVLTLLVGTAIALFWMRPQDKAASLSIPPALVSPIPAPSTNVPATIQVAQVAPEAKVVVPPPPPVRRSPKRSGSLNSGETAQKRLNNAQSPHETSKSVLKRPATAAVWDPDSPLPP